MARTDRYYYEDLKKSEKRKKKEKKGCLRVFLKIILWLVIIGMVAGIAYAAYCILTAPKINPKNIYGTIELSSNIYDDEGNQIDSIYYSENRRIVKYQELPKDLQNAFIAIEDKTFWKHHGFNFKRMIGAVFYAVIGKRGISGTSTITQQLARNVYLPQIKSERSLKRKIIEMYYAFEIERALSKEEILEAYVNTIYLGYGCYGVNSAAKTYFSSGIGDLTLEQCASLAALPQAPDAYALLKNQEGEKCTKLAEGLYANDISQDRRYLVLDLMAEQGYISQSQAKKAQIPLVKFIKPSINNAVENSKTFFKDYLVESVVSDLMNDRGMTEQEAMNMVYTKGLKIYSTLDTQAQTVVAEEFKKDENFPDTVKGEKPEASMVIVEVGTGAIKAMAGGRSPQGEKLFNRATNTRQPGSSIKPLAVYGAALQKSLELQKKGDKWKYIDFGFDSDGMSGYGNYITTSSKIRDEQMVVDGKVWPHNSSGGYSGMNTFRTAIQQSLNTVAVKIQMQVGNDFSAEMLENFGVSTIVTDKTKASNDMNPASLALGGLTHGVMPLEMALAYAAFPNGGSRNTPICYTKVTDKDGKVVLEKKSKAYKAIDPGVAWIMTDVLQSVITDGIAGAAAIDTVKAGGKTGTTSDQYDIWFDGFTPSYAASLWIGTDDNVSLTDMSGPAAALWGRIMNQIPKAKTGNYKDMPDNVVKVNNEYYTKGTEPAGN